MIFPGKSITARLKIPSRSLGATSVGIVIITAAASLNMLSCAALATRVNVLTPEAVPDLRTVAIWPIATYPLVNKFDQKSPALVDTMMANYPDFRSESQNMSRFAEAVLLAELKTSGLFSVVIPADSVGTILVGSDSTFSRFSRIDWQALRHLCPADAVMLTSLSYGWESGGINTYVTLHQCDARSGELVAEAKFNTKWGKSYLTIKSTDVTLPDAIRGAVKGLSGALKKLATDPSKSTS